MSVRRVPDRLPDDSGVVTVDDCPVAWMGWGRSGTALVLVHGGGGNLAWWHDTVRAAPPAQRIVVLDLSGHGSSGRRATYRFETWADEVAGVIIAAAGGMATIVAHSMGGLVGTIAAARHPDAVGALVLVDSIVPLRDAVAWPRVDSPRIHPTAMDAVRGFRLRPNADGVSAEALRRVATQSIGPVQGGYAPRFDGAVFAATDRHLSVELLPRVQAPVSLVRAGSSAVTDDRMASDVESATGRQVREVRVDGGHHFMLDHGDRMIEALEKLGLTMAPSMPTSEGSGR